MPTKNMLIKLKPVQVTWEDACGSEGPFPISEKGYTGLITETVGWLIEKNKNYVVVAQDMHKQVNNQNTIRAIIVIPRGMVRSIKRLK